MRKPETYNPDLKYPELSHSIIGAAFDVHNGLGPGWDEWDYHRAMLKALRTKGLKAESHLRKNLMHRNEPVDQFELDILIEDKVILELKHIRSGFTDQHYTQIINYLKCWKKDLGILINFGMDRLYYKRVPYTPQESIITIDGNWPDFELDHPELAKQITSSATGILELQGLGYGEETSRKILFQEFKYQKLNPKIPEISLHFNNLSFEPRPLHSICLENNVLVYVSAFKDTTATDSARLKSEMRQLSAPFGILVNFGKQELKLSGVIYQPPHS